MGHSLKWWANNIPVRQGKAVPVIFRGAIKRDVDALQKAGIVTVESKILPGHGRMKEVRAGVQQFRLEAIL